MNKELGFTLVELVVVFVLLGTMAAFAAPMFFNIRDYKERAAYDELANALRYAQKLAVGSGCEVQVVFAGTNYSLQQRSTTCTTGPFSTISGHPINNGSISGASISSIPSNFIFSSMGRSSSAATVTVGGRTILVIAETGTVDAQ